MTPSLDTVTAEIVGLHEDFEAWFHGASDSLDSVGAALADEFWFVGPTGTLVDRAGVLGFLEPAKGANSVVIRIENVRILWQRDSLVGVSYEEWQTTTDAGIDTATGRISSAVLERDDAAPRGLRWLNVHETWLDGNGPVES